MLAPLFIIGTARSGTNLAARMVNQHPNIGVALDPLMPVFRAARDAIIRLGGTSELKTRYRPGSPFQDYYFDSLGPQLLDLMLSADLGLPLLDGELKQLRLACVRRARLESEDLAREMNRLSGNTYLDVIRSSFQIILEKKTSAFWVGSKEVWIEDFIPALARGFPDCRFIVTQRDPRSIVASLLALAASDHTQAAHVPSYVRHWRKGASLLRMFMIDERLADRIYMFRYEDAVTSPTLQAKGICEFLRVDFRPEMLSLSADGWAGNSSYQQGEDDIYGSSLARWKQELAIDVRKAVEYMCWPEMRMATYPARCTPPLDADVINYLMKVADEELSWRSDSGDLPADLAWETLRNQLLASGDIEQLNSNPGLVRRAFLFAEVHRDILSSSSKE